jgi:hypothetical protein
MFFYHVQILIRALYAINARGKKMYLGPQIAQRRKVSHGRSTNLTYYLGPQVLRIYDLRNLVADRPPLKITNA